ncbi:hypothetical protein ACB092_08G018300 [Castanea dentata]
MVTKSNIDTPLYSDIGIYSDNGTIIEVFETNEVSKISIGPVQPSQLAIQTTEPKIKPILKTEGPQNTKPSKSTWVRITRSKKEGPQEVLMLEAKPRRAPLHHENNRPMKR